MNKYIVAIAIDKVQTFMFNSIKNYKQSFQTEADTLKSVIKASKEVRGVLKKLVIKTFNISKADILFEISGKIIFCYLGKEENLKTNLKEIFATYYYGRSGQVHVNYFYCKDYEADNVIKIKMCSQKLKEQNLQNLIINENKDILFNFPIDNNYERKLDKLYDELCYEENSEKQLGSKYDNFVDGLDDLNEDVKNQGSKGKIAIIKADINNMGLIMQRVNGENYDKLSKILDEKISLEYIDELLDKSKIKIHPFYAAGDDIFVAARIEDVFKIIDILKNLVIEINNIIELEFYLIQDRLNVSIGVDVNVSDLPIRYYYDNVEKQLKKAKENAKKMTTNEISVSISFNDIQFYCYNNMNDSKNLFDNWYKFKSEVSLLKDIVKIDKDEKVMTRSFLHNILDIIENDEIANSNIKYANALFFRLLPKYLSYPLINQNKCDMDLIVKTMLMRTFLVTVLVRKNKYESIIEINDTNKQIFKAKLKLFMLLSDKRYITYNKELREIKIKDKLSYYKKSYSYDNIKSVLFSKTCDYLNRIYYKNETYDKAKRLFEIFITQKPNKVEIGMDGKKKYESYKLLRLNKSSLYKIKSIQEDDKNSVSKIDKIISILENVTSKYKDEEQEKEINNEAENSRPQVKHIEEFNKEKFEKLVRTEHIEQWNSDFIDSIIVFYECEKYRRIISRIIKSKKSLGGKRRNGNNRKSN